MGVEGTIWDELYKQFKTGQSEDKRNSARELVFSPATDRLLQISSKTPSQTLKDLIRNLVIDQDQLVVAMVYPKLLFGSRTIEDEATRAVVEGDCFDLVRRLTGKLDTTISYKDMILLSASSEQVKWTLRPHKNSITWFSVKTFIPKVDILFVYKDRAIDTSDNSDPAQNFPETIYVRRSIK